MLVAVVGASGGVGSATVKRLLAAGHRVRALCRSRAKLVAVLGVDVAAKLNALVQGDVSDPAALDALMSRDDDEGIGPELVLSCLGTPSGEKPVVEEGTLSLIKAIRAAAGGSEPARLAIVSSIGVGDSYPQAVSMAWFFARCIVPCIMQAVFADLDRAEEACWRETGSAGGVRCVAVRPPALTDRPGVGIAAIKMTSSSELKPAKKAAIAREDVAAAMASLTDPALFDTWAGKGVTVVVPP